MTQPTSPLSEAIPESLDALFSRDPLNMTEDDVGKIVARLRAERAVWAEREANAASRPARGTKPKALPKAQADTAMTLDDLGL